MDTDINVMINIRLNHPGRNSWYPKKATLVKMAEIYFKRLGNIQQMAHFSDCMPKCSNSLMFYL